MHKRNYRRATDIFSLGLIFTFMLFKASNLRIQERLRASKGFDPCPGMLTEKKLNKVTDRIVRKLEPHFNLSVGDLLEKYA